MTNIPTKLVIDCSTGEETLVPLTPEELAKAEQDAIAYDQFLADLKAAEDAKIAAQQSAASKLAALGLTQEEIDSLVK